MKKLMAMVISVVMLLSMAVAMPVSADHEEVNLIVNGSFETFTEDGGTKTITNWEQTNAEALYNHYKNGDSYYRVTGGVVKDTPSAWSLATDGEYGIHHINFADGKAPGIKQTVTIDKSAEWYTNQAKYRFKLSFDLQVAGTKPSGVVTVTTTDSDGFKKSAVYAGGTDFGSDESALTPWAMSNFELDLSELIDSADSAVEKITIELKNNNYINGEAAWDNVKLTPVYDENKVVAEKPLNLIKNGSFEYVENGNILLWEQTNADISYGILQSGATDGQNRIHYTNLADNAYPGVKQTVTIDKSAEWYTNQAKYRYMLTFDGLVGGFTPTGIIEVTTTDADGFKKSAVYAGGTDFGSDQSLITPWAMESFSVDLSNLIDSADSSVEKIEITLRNNPYINGQMAWDNVKLTPVYDENKVVEKTLNLIKNGSFEYVENGSILLWEQTNADISYGILQSGATDGQNRIHYTNLADNAYPGVKQTVTIDKSAEWYTNQAKYRYMLTFDGLVGGFTPTGIIEVTTTDADGFKKSAVYAGGTDFGSDQSLITPWAMESFSVDLSNLIDSADSSVEKIEITLRNNPYINGQMAWDNVKLTPVYDESKVVEKTLNLIKNGGFEYFTETESGRELLVWEHSNPDVKYNHYKNGDSYYRVTGGVVKDTPSTWTLATEGLYGVHYINYADNEYPGLKQTITFGESDAWYTNQDKYRFMLSFDGQVAGLTSTGIVAVTAYDAEGVSNTVLFRGGTDFGADMEETQYWTMQSFTLDISDVLDALETNAVKIDIELRNNAHINGEMAWDNVVLTPVYDEDKVVPVNLIKNSGFEKDEVGTTEFEGWTQTGDPEIVFTVSEEQDIGKVARYDVTPGAVASLTQTVTMDTEADWYKDFRNYRFVLSYDSYAPGSAYRGNVKVTVTGVNGVTGTTTYDFPYPVATGDQWKMNTFTRDLKDFIDTSIGIQPVKSIDVVLVGTHPNGGSIFYDNIKLYAEYVKPDTAYNYAVNPGFETLENDVLTGWTFSGADQDEVLGMDSAGTEGNNYVAIPTGAYAQLTLTGEQLPAGAAYLVQFDYKSLGDGGEMKVLNIAKENAEILSVKCGGATGTSVENAVWKTYKDIIVMSEADTEGICLLLCNTDVTGNEYVYYDNLKITKINGYDMDNLLKNGDFEVAASNGSTSIPGWTQTVEAKKGALILTESDYDVQLPGGMYAINQTALISDYDTANGKNHGYKLEYDVYGNYHKFTVTITFDGGESGDIVFPFEVTSIRSSEINEDGLYTGPEGDPNQTPVSLAENSYVIADLDVPTHIEYDLTWLAQQYTYPIKSIDIKISSQGSAVNFDNVRLLCRKNTVNIIDADGNTVNKITTAEDAVLKARVRCYTDDANAKVYFAVYEKDSDGTLAMKDIVIAPLSGDGEEKYAETAAITADMTEGKTIVKAVVWGGANKMTPITKLEIK